MEELTADQFWYKDTIIYQLHVKAFHDDNDDGIGDFSGLIQKLDYIKDLGIGAIWLLPFYPSPMRDDGYDISDYRGVYPDYGTLKDFRVFIREAHSRGIRVITELVINHTSDQHPWFKAARVAKPGTRKRDFYVWSKTNQKFPETRIIFTDSETSNWTWDNEAQAYYWHRFFHHQPDLNHNNPEVVKAVIRVMRFWLDMGVDGLRLDAIPYLCVREGTNNENLPETHAVLKYMRSVVDAHYKNRMLLAEANQWPEDAQAYFGQGDECHMAYHFPLMPRLYMALAQEDRHPIVEIMQQTPEIPSSCQWAIFLRNHDELTLEMVTDRERDYMYERFAVDPRMRINAGIRRRLAPLIDNDLDKIKLMNSLLMSMPGSPIIYYGDEIGMGDNFFLGDRNGMRTPMQWSPDRNGGFSKADPQFLYLPPIMDPVYGYEAVNVEAQNREPFSLLNWMKRLIAVRKAHPVFGRGKLVFLNPGNRKILAYTREHLGESILCVANLSRSAQPVELDLSCYKRRVPVEMLGRTSFPPIGDLPYLLTLPGHGVYWFRLAAEMDAPSWHEEGLPALELPLMVLFDTWRSLFPERVGDQRRGMAERLKEQLTRLVLPSYLSKQRWFSARMEKLERVEITDLFVWADDVESDGWLWVVVEVYFVGVEPQHYLIPLAVTWGELDEQHIRPLLPSALSRVRKQAQVGIIYDAILDEAFVQNTLQAIRDSSEISVGTGKLIFQSTKLFSEFVPEQPLTGLRRSIAEGTNSSVILGDQLMFKLYRRLEKGVNPEFEIGRYLTEVAHFQNISSLVGSVEHRDSEGRATTLLLIQAYVPNQGDGWGHSLDYLERFFDECLLLKQDDDRESIELHSVYCWMMNTLGVRTAELHRALALPSDDPNFKPLNIEPQQIDHWVEQIRHDVNVTINMLEHSRVNIAECYWVMVDQLLQAKPLLLERIVELTPCSVNAVITRYHGDYHLGQVLLVQNDFIIVDFEGEPARPINRRRAKHSPLRDVAGMLRSFSYAAVTALNQYTAERPENRALLLPYAKAWEAAAKEAFLAGYKKCIADCPSWPSESSQADTLLELFVLEKALYELRYELSHRPDWVGIPLVGLLDILQLPNNNNSG